VRPLNSGEQEVLKVIVSGLREPERSMLNQQISHLHVGQGGSANWI
jgi:hypothetical protein